MIQLIEHLAAFTPNNESISQQQQQQQHDPLSLGDTSQCDRKHKYLEIRASIINAKLESMDSVAAGEWRDMREEIKKVNEIQSRSLGKKKLNNLIQPDNQPTSAAEDSLARYQDDLDDGDELPGLNNDEISDRDDLAEGVSQETKENVFESLCAKNSAASIKDDIFDDYESSSSSSDDDSNNQKSETKKEAKEDEGEEEELEKVEEKMDTSSPWPESGSNNANVSNPVTPTFNAWVTPAASAATTETGETAASNSSGTSNSGNNDTGGGVNNAGWASFDTADFGPPHLSSSPSQAKMETDDKSHELGNGDNQRSDSSTSS